ncbi:RIO-type serine/threonine-protein kinase Rio1 [Nanoarchaeota archaeon]
MKYREIWKVYGKVFDNNTFEYLEELYNDKYIKDELILIDEGKESIVFRSGNSAIKIYKIMARSYKEQIRYLKADPRIKDFPRTKIGIIYTWVKKEYINLRKMYKNLIRVPAPYVYKGNVLVMEYIGDNNGSKILHNNYNYIEDKEKFFYSILEEYKKIYNKAQLIHGDFSEYNIIIYKNVPYIIDVSQAIPITSTYSEEFLNRDINNIFNISKKLGLSIDINFIKQYIGI